MSKYPRELNVDNIQGLNMDKSNDRGGWTWTKPNILCLILYPYLSLLNKNACGGLVEING